MMSSISARLASLVLFAAGGASSAPLAWVQMTGAGAEARVVTEAPACPVIAIDGRRRRMAERAAPTEAFPNRICSAALPPRAGRVRIDGRGLPLPRARPNRLVIFGDSGCRLKGKITQHCNDPRGWPFAKVAALAAARRPDLVIHVGDYYYREKACPAGEAACASSPFGDKWLTWKAEVFDPAAALLAAAPWVFARGNHEVCARGGAGWFRLLDAAPAARTCPAQADSFAVDLGGVRLLVVDSSDTQDFAAPADRVAVFTARLGILAKVRGEPAWIVTHRPFWFAARRGDTLVDGLVNATERAAASGAHLDDVQLVLSGHVHDFTAVDFGPKRPAQLIVGTGGDLLEAGDLPPPAAGATVVDGLPAKAFSMGRFGYFVFDRQGADWVGGFHDLTDALITRCRLRARSLTCVAVAEPAGSDR
ncbi:MAG TPA: metallophosphoesterase [Caulobacteraceae bacterium]